MTVFHDGEIRKNCILQVDPDHLSHNWTKVVILGDPLIRFGTTSPSHLLYGTYITQVCQGCEVDHMQSQLQIREHAHQLRDCT